MEVIDKAHNQAKKIIVQPYISFSHDMNRFFINSPGVNIFNLSAGAYLHFLNDVDRLYIYFNDDPTGIIGRDNQGGLVFASAPVLKLLNRKNELIKPSSKFPLRKNCTQVKECITLEIMIHNKIRNKNK